MNQIRILFLSLLLAGCGPAAQKVECSDGSIEWRLNGKLHREDGPAVVRPDGTKEWWVEGHRLQPLEFVVWRHTRDLPGIFLLREIEKEAQR